MARKLLNGCCGIFLSLATAASAAEAESPNAKHAKIDTRIVAQEGLAIAFASTVLQTQLVVLVEADGADFTTCQSSDGVTGSYISPSQTIVNATTSKFDLQFFYDSQCKNLFAEAKVTSTTESSEIHIVGKVHYRNLSEKAVGVLNINERAFFTGPVSSTNSMLDSVVGLGTFTPSNGKPRVSLGLDCQLTDFSAMPCEGGVTQDFPALGISMGSVSPLTLDVFATPLTFSGTPSTMGIGALGGLSLGIVNKDHLALVGNPSGNYSTSASGEAGAFELFPPPPTDWTVTDSYNGQKFSIGVVSATVLNSVGSVVDTKTNATLATITVDQSGAGQIKYTGGPTEPITCWTLGD